MCLTVVGLLDSIWRKQPVEQAKYLIFKLYLGYIPLNDIVIFIREQLPGFLMFTVGALR